jgi:hypothetical protein
MPSLRKFKIGQIVLYRRDLFRIIARLEVAGDEPAYRIKRETDDNERVVLERDLTDPSPHKHSRTRKPCTPFDIMSLCGSTLPSKRAN